MLITLIICATIVAIVYTFCHFSNKMNSYDKEHNAFVNDLHHDITEIFYIISTIKEDDVYGAVKDKIMHIKHISRMYGEEIDDLVETVLDKCPKDN